MKEKNTKYDILIELNEAHERHMGYEILMKNTSGISKKKCQDQEKYRGYLRQKRGF